MDTETAINTATSPQVFDVLAFVEQTAYPEEDVVVFQDVKSAAEYSKHVADRFELEKLDDDESKAKVAALTARIEQLGEKISKSALVFHLRGLPPKLVSETWDSVKLAENATDAERETFERERDARLIAATIQSVANSEGAVDTRLWDSEQVAKLRGFLKEGEFGKLTRGVSEVNFNAMVFDKAADAGFSGRSTHLAA